jgi:hypothetical protein
MFACWFAVVPEEGSGSASGLTSPKKQTEFFFVVSHLGDGAKTAFGKPTSKLKWAIDIPIAAAHL